MRPPLPVLALLGLILLGAGSAGASPTALCTAAIARAEREAGLPPRLLAAMGRVESGRRDPDSGATGPWPWTINAEGRGSFFPDRAAAIAAVRALQAQGVRSIDVGCLQINLRHHPQAFASLEEAFEPLANARYAARFLGELHATRGDWMRAAAHYHSQTPELAEAYRARVAAAWAEERAQPAAPSLIPGLADRGGRIVQQGGLPPAPGGSGAAPAGRGLDAYRAQPIPLVGAPGRIIPASAAAPAPPTLRGGAAVAAPARPAAAPAGMPALAAPGLGLPAPRGPAPAGPAPPAPGRGVAVLDLFGLGGARPGGPLPPAPARRS